MQFTLTPHAKKRIEQRGIPVPDSGMNMKPAGRKTRRIIRELCAKSGIQFDKIYWTYQMDTSEGRKIVVYVCTLVDVGSYMVITAFILNSVTNHQKDMPKSVVIPGGVLHMAESNAICPHCEHIFTVDILEPLFQKCKTYWFRKKCVCGRFVGITTDLKGDFVAYDLKG